NSRANTFVSCGLLLPILNRRRRWRWLPFSFFLFLRRRAPLFGQKRSLHDEAFARLVRGLGAALDSCASSLVAAAKAQESLGGRWSSGTRLRRQRGSSAR